MDGNVTEALNRVRARRRHISDLEGQLESERAALGMDLQQLIDSSGLSARALAEQLGYRSETSVRRAVHRSRPSTGGKTPTDASPDADRPPAHSPAGSAGTTA